MSHSKKSFRVKVQYQTVTVYPWNGKWRYAYRDANGVRKYRTSQSKTKIRELAEAECRRMMTDGERLELEGKSEAYRVALARILKDLPDVDELREFRAWRERKTSGEVVRAAVERFIAWKVESKGRKSEHLETVERDLLGMVEAFDGRTVASIESVELGAWFDQRTKDVAAARRKGVRSSLTSFFTWCNRAGGITSVPVTAADRLPGVTVERGEIHILTVPQMAKLLEGCPEEWVPWVVLCGFAGMRPEEVAPKRKSHKGIFQGKWIDYGAGVIRLPARQAKGGKRARIIPLHPVCVAWLRHMGANTIAGDIVPGNASEHDLTDLLGDLIGGWHPDVLRHSYGSYRNALIHDLPRLSGEMGNSVKMLHDHYHNPQTEELAAAYFALTPEAVSCGTFAELKVAG